MLWRELPEDTTTAAIATAAASTAARIRPWCFYCLLRCRLGATFDMHELDWLAISRIIKRARVLIQKILRCRLVVSFALFVAVVEAVGHFHDVIVLSARELAIKFRTRAAAGCWLAGWLGPGWLASRLLCAMLFVFVCWS